MDTTTLLKFLTLIVVLTAESAAEGTIDFRNDLIPVFTKRGCNAGACHGAAIGRGGFKLSLYGANPAADYDAIVRQIGGRRINLAKPDQSLLVLKPAEYLEHGGGSVIDIDGESARLLQGWIRQGAHDESTRQLERVEVQPPKHIAQGLGESVQLHVVAYYSDGSSRDVTRWTVFSPEDPSAVEIKARNRAISAERVGASGQHVAKMLRRGRHIVVTRYLNEVVPVELIVPLTESTVDLASVDRSNFIDDEVLESLATLRLLPSARADDTTFLRRIYLDLTGRLPTQTQTQAFLSPPARSNENERKRAHTPERLAANRSRRAALVDELLQSEEFTEYWTLQMAKLLRIQPRQNDTQGALAYHKWVAEQIKNDVSYRRIVRELILSAGDTYKVGPANFHRTGAGPREQAEFVSELFMGSRLRCANCHNHPLDRWTQDDYHGLAAIFAKIERGRIVSAKPNGETIHPRTLEPAVQRIPGDQFLADDATDGRKQLGDWLTAPSNPYFAKAFVNRLWKRMMGRGLVEPVDDFRDTNPATHPDLLDELANDFVEHGYSLKHTLRVIASSNAYSRSAVVTKENRDDDRFYSHALQRPLEPEVLADAISDVLGVADSYGDEPSGTRAVALVDATTPSRTLDILGRCNRDASCESTPGVVSGLSQKLHLFNGDLLNARIAAEGSRLRRLLEAGREPEEIISEFYVVALARDPTAKEKELWQRQLRSVDNKETFLEDFVWGLLSSNEFVTNH